MLPQFVYFAYYAVRARIAHLLAHILVYLRTTSSPPYPTPFPAISCVWLTRVLRAQGHITHSTRVSSVDMGKFDAAGFEGIMKKIKVEYVDERTNQPATGPPSFVLKTSPNSLSTRYNIITGGNDREAIFYEHPYSKQVKIPKVIYTYASRLLGEKLMLLEDVTLQPEFTKVGNVFGNQIWGAKPTKYKPAEVIKKMYMYAAAQHAKFWKDENLLEQTWLRESGWYKNKNRHLWERSMDSGREAWGKVKAKISAGKMGFEFSQKLSNIIDKSFARTSWAALQAHLQNPATPWTFCHGDFHAGNMLLANDELLMVDWSLCGPWEPTTDLAQTIISDVKPEVFKNNTKEWLRTYWERLMQLGISEKEYPFSVCWDRFCQGGVERWIWIFVIMAEMPAVPPQLTQYFHDQILAFIESHGDFESYTLKPVVIIA